MEGWILAVAAAAGVYEIVLKKLKDAAPSPPPINVGFGFDADVDGVVAGADFLRLVEVHPASTSLFEHVDVDSVFYRCRLSSAVPGAVTVGAAIIFRDQHQQPTSNMTTTAGVTPSASAYLPQDAK